MTRREMNGGLAAAVAALIASGPAAAAAGALAPPAAGGQKPAARRGAGIRTLMQEPLGEIPNPEVSVITLTMPPGANSRPHEHIGPVFAYILEGEIENQVEPNPPRTYRAGDYFYEPAMHVHRMMRNLSATRPAKLLIFQVAEKGKQFTIPVRS